MLPPQLQVIIFQRNKCLSTAHVVVVLPRKMAENFAIKYQMVTKAGVSGIPKWLVAPIDVNVLIVEILMVAPRLPSRHTHT